MAAAALSRSRGEAGVRTTKGLLFIFTLLSLVCLASSLIGKDQLEKLKENFQKARQQTDSLKAEYESEMATASELISGYMSLMDPMIALVKKASKALPDLPPMEGLLENTKGFMERINTYVDRKNEEFGARMENTEQKLGKIQKLIKLLEEQQAEL